MPYSAPVRGSTDPTHKRAASVLPAEAPPLAPDSGAPEGPGGGAPGRPTPPSRAELERVRARDPVALGAFFERYFDRVYGLVYHLLGERAAAEDATQEVFLKVHRAADQLDPARDPAPWLAAIAHNTCRDLWRSAAHRMRRRSDPIAADGPLPRELAHGDDPERAALGAERERLVRAAIARLPEPMRAVVLLHDYQGLNHQEIAELLAVNHAAARKRYSRALKELGRLLEETLG